MKSIEDLCEKCSNSVVFGKGLRKTAARTLLFLSEAVSGRRWAAIRRGPAREKEPLIAAHIVGNIYIYIYIQILRARGLNLGQSTSKFML